MAPDTQTQVTTNEPLEKWKEELKHKLQASFIVKPDFEAKATPSKTFRVESTEMFDLVRMSIVEMCKDLKPGENTKQLFITDESVSFVVNSGKLCAEFTYTWVDKP